MTDVEARLRELVIETPSWGYGDSGTRFGVFPQPGRPRDVFERVDDAAEVHRLTGTAGAVALHFPWDAVDDYGALREHIEARGLRVGAVNPNLFQDPDYKLGSITHPDAARAREGRRRTCSSASRSPPSSARPRSRCGSPTAPTTRARTTCASAARGCSTSLERVYAALPAEQELLVEYKLFEPAFYATDLADWGSRAADLPEARRARAGAGRPRPPRAGREHRADRRAPRRRGPARRLPLQQPQVRRRRPDRRLGQPVRAVPDLLRARRRRTAAAAPDDRPVPQRRGEGRGDGAVRRQPPGGLREGAARRPRGAARRPGRRATCSAATRCCSTPSAPTSGRCAPARAAALGAAEDPIARPARVRATPSAWPPSARPSRS